jgi:hypothetical protein
MSRTMRRVFAALIACAALASAGRAPAATVVLDGTSGAAYESVGDGWFFAGGPGIPPDGVGDLDGQALSVASQAGVVEIRAMAEFSLAPLAGVDPSDVVSATITYTIDDVLSGLGPGTAFDGTAGDPIDVYAYPADGTVVAADFAPAGLTLLDSVAAGVITDASLAVSGAVAFQVDATATLQGLLTGAATHIGVLFDTNDSPTGTSLDNLGVAGAQFPFITVEVLDPTTTTTLESTTTSTSSSSTSSSSSSSSSTSTSSTSSTTLPPTADQPRDAVRVLLKARNGKEKLVWVSKTPTLVLPTGDPTLVGASLEVRNPVTLESSTLPLPAEGWSANAAGTVLKFKNPAAPAGTAVKVAVIKASVLKVVAKGTGITLDEAMQGAVELALTVGTDRYCSSCSTATKDEGAAGPDGQYLAKSCPVPPSCE